MSSGPTKGNKVYLTIIGVLIVIVVIVGSIALYRPTAGNTAAQSPSLSGANANDPTGSPTSTLSRTPTAIPTPAGKVIPENMTIPCTSTYLPSELGGLQCKDLGITVSLNSIVIVPGGTMNWNFTVTNISPQPITVNATTDRATIYLEDSAGTPTKLNGGTFLDDTNLSGNQSLPITAIFPLAPTPDAPYYLHMTLYVMHVSANRWDYSTYATQKFTF